MSTGRAPVEWDAVKHWFHLALEQPEQSRDTFVGSALLDAPLLRDEVLSLLAAHAAADARFERTTTEPIAEDASSIVDGTIIGPWCVRGRLGEGGMAIVYDAVHRDAAMPKRAALKVIRGRASADLDRRFRRERQILATLDHPNIAALLDGGSLEDGAPWLAMEYVDGVRIDEWCRARTLDVRARVRLMLHVCRAVQYAHTRLVVHRDLKPSNILVTADGAVKLLDFGIAKLAADVDGPDRTITGVTLLTVDYASPEQLRGDPVSAASDVYALGVVLFELLSGTRPFAMSGHGLRELHRLADSDAPSVRAVLSPLLAQRAGLPNVERARLDVSGDLDAVVAKALRKHVAERYDTVEHLADDLVAWLEMRPVRAQPDTFWYRLRRHARRNRTTLVAVSAAVLGAAGIVAALAWQERRTARERIIAAQRLDEVRTLARTLVYDVNDRLADVPGATQLRAAVVRTALQSLNRASSDAPRDPVLMREMAFAYQRAGDILGNPTGVNLGDLEGARDAHLRGVAIARALVALTPEDVDALWTLALCAEKAADVTAPLGQVDTALALQQESFALFSRIARSDPTNTRFQSTAGVSALKLGDLLGNPSFVNLGDPDAALRAFRESMTALDAAQARGDTSFFVRRHRAVAAERLGRMLMDRREFVEGRSWLDSAVAGRRALLAEAPGNPTRERDLAIALYVRCGLDLAEQRAAHARAACGESLAIRQALLARDPSNPSLVRGMGIMYRRLGELHAMARDTARAVSAYERSVEYYERYFGDRMGAVNDRRDFATALLELAELQNGRAPTLAVRSYRRALASFDSVATKLPITASDSAAIARTARRIGVGIEPSENEQIPLQGDRRINRSN
jgi:non-specific serine/threonine protein kinase/serine/threonine-protein kinase